MSHDGIHSLKQADSTQPCGENHRHAADGSDRGRDLPGGCGIMLMALHGDGILASFVGGSSKGFPQKRQVAERGDFLKNCLDHTIRPDDKRAALNPHVAVE